MALMEMASTLSSKNFNETVEEKNCCTESDDITPRQQETDLQTNEEDVLSSPIITSLSQLSSAGPEPEAPKKSESGSNVSELGYNSEWDDGSRERAAHHLNMATTPLQVFLTNMSWYRMHTNDSVQSNDFLRKQKKKRCMWIKICVISCLILIVICVISVLLSSHVKDIEITSNVNNSRLSSRDDFNPIKLLCHEGCNDVTYTHVNQNVSIISDKFKEILNKSTNQTSPDHH